MREIWDIITTAKSFGEVWDWYLLQELGMQLFLGAVTIGVTLAILIIIFASFNLED